MPRPKTTEQLIEELAQAVNRGFSETATKAQLQLVADNLDLARADIHDIKITLGPLVRHVAAMEEKVLELEKRLERVEHHVGL